MSYPPNLERAAAPATALATAAVGMRDGVPANRAGATLKPYDLALKAIAQPDDAGTVREERSAILCEEGKCDENPSPENVLSLSPPMP